MSVKLQENEKLYAVYRAHWDKCAKCERQLSTAWSILDYSSRMFDAKCAEDVIEAVFDNDALCPVGMKLYFDSIEGPWRVDSVKLTEADEELIRLKRILRENMA